MTAQQMLIQASFQAMGVTVTIAGTGVSEWDFSRGLTLARSAAGEWEARFSRFRNDSELSAVNRADGRAVAVSKHFLEMLDLAIAGVRETDGRFDPAILPYLEAAGYDRSFELLPKEVAVPYSASSGGTQTRWTEAVVADRQAGTVRLPLGIRLDFGGIAKGAFVDHVSTQLESWPGGFVDAGGDLRVWGSPPGGGAWTATIEDPSEPERTIARIPISGPDRAAVATSGTYRRRWRRRDGEANHLIDPASGEPVRSRAQGVTVFASRVVDAEMDAKSIMVALSRGSRPEITFGTMAVISGKDGRYEVIEASGGIAPARGSDSVRATS